MLVLKKALTCQAACGSLWASSYQYYITINILSWHVTHPECCQSCYLYPYFPECRFFLVCRVSFRRVAAGPLHQSHSLNFAFLSCSSSLHVISRCVTQHSGDDGTFWSLRGSHDGFICSCSVTRVSSTCPFYVSVSDVGKSSLLLRFADNSFSGELTQIFEKSSSPEQNWASKIIFIQLSHLTVFS